MYLVLLPALIALLLKLYVLFRNRIEGWNDKSWGGVILAFAALNLSELVVYSVSYSGYSPDNLVRVYYICCLFASFTCFAYLLRTDILWQKIIVIASSLPVLPLSIMIFFTDLVVGDVETVDVLVKAYKGPMFVLFQVYALFNAIVSLGALVWNYRNAETVFERNKQGYNILAVIPIFVTILIVIGFMMIGLKANGSMFLPLGTTFFLMISSSCKAAKDIRYDLRRIFSPKSAVSKAGRKIDLIQAKLALDEINYKDAVEAIEAELMDMLIEKSGGNISEVARNAGIARSMVYRKRKG